MNSLIELYKKVEHLVHEGFKFGLVGLAGFAVQLSLFNLLRFNSELYLRSLYYLRRSDQDWSNWSTISLSLLFSSGPATAALTAATPTIPSWRNTDLMIGFNSLAVPLACII